MCQSPCFSSEDAGSAMQGTSKVPVLCVYSVSYLVSFFGAIRENGDFITISVFQCSVLVFEGTRVGFILLIFAHFQDHPRFLLGQWWLFWWFDFFNYFEWYTRLFGQGSSTPGEWWSHLFVSLEGVTGIPSKPGIVCWVSFVSLHSDSILYQQLFSP